MKEAIVDVVGVAKRQWHGGASQRMERVVVGASNDDGQLSKLRGRNHGWQETLQSKTGLGGASVHTSPNKQTPERSGSQD